MPKKFALNQVLRNRTAVDRDEGFPRSRTLIVNRPSHEFFTGSALSVDKHVRLRFSDLADEFVDLLHHAAMPDDIPAA